MRKQLFFGSPEKLPEGAAGAITGERRKLLLTISGLPDPERKRVEKLAASDQVPLDTLYGVLAALGETGIGKDPAALDAALKAQAGRLKTILDERKALSLDDPELQRLVAEADQAVSEGAIKTARSLLDEAKAHVETTRSSIEDVEAQARAKRMANAEILVKSAETAEIDFDFAAAAKDYASAFDWVKEADKVTAAKYKTYEADALQSIGNYRGDNQALAQAIAGYEQALGLVSRPQDAVQWGKATNNMANALLRMGERTLDQAPLEKAVALYRDVLSVDGGKPSLRATTFSNLGIALNTLADRRNDAGLYADAGKAFDDALALRDKASDGLGWALDMLNAANLEIALADRNTEPARYKSAEEKITAALELIDPVTNRIEWAQAKNNLAISLRAQGANTRDVAKVRDALRIYEEVLPAFDRKTFPLDWGNTNGNIAIAHTNIGAMEGNAAEFETALDFYRLGLAGSDARAHARVLGQAAECLWHDAPGRRHHEVRPRIAGRCSAGFPGRSRSPHPRGQCRTLGREPADAGLHTVLDRLFEGRSRFGGRGDCRLPLSPRSLHEGRLPGGLDVSVVGPRHGAAGQGHPEAGRQDPEGSRGHLQGGAGGNRSQRPSAGLGLRHEGHRHDPVHAGHHPHEQG